MDQVDNGWTITGFHGTKRFLGGNTLGRQQQFWSGGWWRFTKYEIRDGAIRPAANASLEQYDPWDLYRISQIDSETPRPYQCLLALLLSMGACFDEKAGRWTLEKSLDDASLSLSDQNEILNWCSRFGLLGILPHTAVIIELPPFWDTASVDDKDPWEDGAELRRTGERTNAGVRRARTNGEWKTILLMPVEGRPEYVSFDGPGAGILLLKPNPIPEAFFHGFLIDGRSSFPVSSMLPVFFPDFVDEGDDFECPAFLSREFWQIYSEPVEEFLAFAMAFLSAVEPVLAHRAEAHLHQFERFLEPMGISLSFDPKGNVQEQWVCPSLLSSFARMALQDLSAGMRILRRECCKGPFVTGAYQARYCSHKCAWKQRKRRARAPRNEQGGTDTINP
jgi:hypothetical protein